MEDQSTRPRLGRGRRGNALLLIAAVVALLVAVDAPLTAAADAPSFAARASSICQHAQRVLARTSTTSATSLAQALQIARSDNNTFSSEVTQLSGLRPPTPIAASFHAAVADEAAVVNLLRPLLTWPRYEEIVIILSYDRARAPAWLKTELSRIQALASDAHARFEQLHLPACAGKS